MTTVPCIDQNQFPERWQHGRPHLSFLWSSGLATATPATFATHRHHIQPTNCSKSSNCSGSRSGEHVIARTYPNWSVEQVVCHV